MRHPHPLPGMLFMLFSSLSISLIVFFNIRCSDMFMLLSSFIFHLVSVSVRKIVVARHPFPDFSLPQTPPLLPRSKRGVWNKTRHHIFETLNLGVFLLVRVGGSMAYGVRCAKCDVISRKVAASTPLLKFLATPLSLLMTGQKREPKELRVQVFCPECWF